MTSSNKKLSLGILMDPIAHINPKKDSSFALLLAAQKRNWNIFYMEAQDLLLENSEEALPKPEFCSSSRKTEDEKRSVFDSREHVRRVQHRRQGFDDEIGQKAQFCKKPIPKATLRPLKVWDRSEHWFELGEKTEPCPLTELDVIFMRLDPPVDQAYLHITQLLSLAEAGGAWVINKPQSLRDYNEKLLALQFPEYCPPTLVTQSKVAAHQFLEKHKEVVVKPLDGMGGQAIFRLHSQDPNQHVIFETLAARKEQYFLIQRYLPEIKEGDKRIILINGEPISYALARLPAKGETRANLAAGGHGVAQPLTNRDLEICKKVAPFLREKGLIWVGLDVIGNYLTEINITSPTCIRELDAQCNLHIGERLLEYVESQLKHHPRLDPPDENYS